MNGKMKLYLILPSSDTRIKAVMLPEGIHACEPFCGVKGRKFKGNYGCDKPNECMSFKLRVEEYNRLISEAPFVKDQEQAVELLYADSRLVEKDHPYLIDGMKLEFENACAHDSCPVDGACEHCKEPIKLAVLVPIAKEEPKTFDCYLHGKCEKHCGNTNYCPEVKPVESTESVCAMCGGSGIIGNGPTSFNKQICKCKTPVESADNATAFNNKSKFSNSEIGSHHWSATVLSFIMRVGEYLEENGATQSPYYRDWGTGIKDRAKEVNNFIHSLPDVAEPTEGNGGWISVDSGNPKDSEYYLTVQIGNSPLIALFVDSSFYWGGNIIFPDFYQPLPDTTKLTNE